MVIWEAYANLIRGQYRHVGSKAWVAMHYCGAVHPVTVTEDPEGGYWGWRWADSAPNSLPTMIQPSKLLLNIYLPMGVDGAAATERGQIVRLTITPREE